VVTWHQYLLGAGVDPAVGDKALDPAWLDRQKAAGAAVDAAVTGSRAQPPPQLWMGEAGGAYNSGAHGVTDAFHGSFWFLDGFGILAQRGHQTFCRQTLAGGNYGLLNTSTLQPNPDLYALLLWRRLMGRGVLNVSSLAADARTKHQPSTTSYLRAYAHCAASPFHAGDVTLLLLNLAPNETAEVEVRGLGRAPSAREEYTMSAEALSSQVVRLNGVELHAAENGTIPELTPRVVQPTGGSLPPITLAPLTYGFYVLRGVGASACTQ
jgi:heparanase 1